MHALACLGLTVVLLACHDTYPAYLNLPNHLPGTDGEGKYAPFKVFGWWHWEIDLLLKGVLFRSSTIEVPLPKVLAVAPGANLYFPNFHDILDFVNNMAKLAVMSDRVLVWPHIDCRCEGALAACFVAAALLNFALLGETGGLAFFAQCCCS